MVETDKKTSDKRGGGGGPSRREREREQSPEAARRTRRGSRQWLETMIGGEEFFGSCEVHRALRKSEVNVYCVDCSRRMCPHCLPMEASCPHECLLQIRRYVYQDVVRISDMQKLVDCSDVQPYIVNGAKVVLLKPRRTSKASKSASGCPACELSGRSMAVANRYCSLFCKFTVKDETSRAHPVDCDDASGPPPPDRTPEPSSPSESPPPHDENIEGDGSRWILGSPCAKRNRDRKGSPPHRSPFF